MSIEDSIREECHALKLDIDILKGMDNASDVLAYARLSIEGKDTTYKQKTAYEKYKTLL